MKKNLASAGLTAIGVASLHAATYAPDVTAMDASRMWSVSGTLRGFYDDNYTTAPNGPGKHGSSGFEFSPTVNLLMPLQQTELGLKYTYGLYYYQYREDQGAKPIDQSQEADLWIDHAFTERMEGKILDAFTYSQEPSLSAAPTAAPYRTSGNNVQNVGTVSLHTELSMLFSTDVGYQNNWQDYSERGATTTSVGDGSGAKYAGLLNQIGQNVYLNLNYQFLPDLTFFVGYNFGVVDYTGNEPIAQDPISGNFYFSDSRNQYSHNLYVGTQYAATEALSASAQIGIQYTHLYNLPSFDSQDPDQWSPTANIAVTYTFLPGSYVQAGFTESIGSSDISTVNSAGQLTLTTENSVVFATINYQVTPKLLASVIGHYQNSIYNGGAFDNGTQNWYSAGLNLTYAFNMYLSAEIGYNYDLLNTVVAGQGYTRNREYFGFTGTF